MPPLQPSDHTLAEGDRSARGRFPHMIGTSPRRKEDQRLLLGGGRFVDDQRLPALATAGSALGSATRLHDGWSDNTAIVAKGAVGDAEAAMTGAHLVVHEKLRHPRLSAAPIETRGAFAYKDRESGALVVSSSTQSPYTLRDAVAAALKLPVER